MMINGDIAAIHTQLESSIDALRLTVHMHAHEYQLLQEFIRSLQRPDGVTGTYINLGFTPGSLQGLIIQMHLEKAESFKAGTPIIDWLLSRGFVQDGNYENAGWGYRQISFKKIDESAPLFWPVHHAWKPYKLTATLRMWPHHDGQLCKKVEDGHEPKYKFVCEAEA